MYNETAGHQCDYYSKGHSKIISSIFQAALLSRSNQKSRNEAGTKVIGGTFSNVYYKKSSLKIKCIRINKYFYILFI